MSVSVTMPQLGESVTEGTIIRWLKKEGDEIAVDEPLLEVSTDKVDTEIPAPSAGVLLRILAQEDDTVAVGAELAVIGAPNEAPLRPAGSSDAASQEPSDDAAQQAASQRTPQQPTVPEPAPEQVAEVERQAADDAAEAEQPAQPDQQPAPEQTSSDQPSGGERTSVVLPALGESVTEGIVTRWLKQVGDEVAVDEPLVEVSTDKVDTEIPSPVAGTLLEVVVPADGTVPVGGELAVIGAGTSATSAAAQPGAAQAPSTPSSAPTLPSSPADASGAARAMAPATPDSPAEADPQRGSARDRHADPDPDARANGSPFSGYVTPLVRKLAGEYDVDLAGLQGTGVGGRIRKEDVLEAAKTARRPQPTEQQAQPPSQPPSQQVSTRARPEPVAAQRSTPSPVAAAAASAPQSTPSAVRGRTEPLSRLRKVIASRMQESLLHSAQLTTVVEVDVSRIGALRNRAKADFEAREGVKLSYLPFFAKATVEALKQFPALNASIDTDAATVTYHDAVNLGIAVDTERGLLVPVVHDAGDLSVAGLAKRIADLADRTRRSRITPDELTGGTFTVTNTGSRGALFDTPIINQPEAGILGTGAVVQRPVVVPDETGGNVIAVRSMLYLALTYDHRLVDGADAARFLVAIKQRLEDGAFESDLGV